MEKETFKILDEFRKGKLTRYEAKCELFALFGVMQRSEQVCEHPLHNRQKGNRCGNCGEFLPMLDD